MTCPFPDKQEHDPRRTTTEKPMTWLSTWRSNAFEIEETK